MTAGAAIYGCSGAALTADEAKFFADADPWGFILFTRNVDTPDQLRRLTGGLRDAVGRDAPVLVDQEGGRVQRLRPPHWRAWLPPLDQMVRAGPEHAVRAMYLRYRLLGAELRAVGIDTNCAPVGDVATSQTHPFLRNRCYGETADIVANAARAVADGLLASGVLPVLKHLPGHGRAVADSHLDLPVVTADRNLLDVVDFRPFRALVDLPLAMTAHILYTAMDCDRPATLSADVIGVIRKEIGFHGLLMTDDISMGALQGTLAERVTGSLSAGCDLILHCNGEFDEMKAVAENAGRMTEAAAARGEAALIRRRVPQSSLDDLSDEFDALMAAQGNADA